MHYDDTSDLNASVGSLYCAGRFVYGAGAYGTVRNLYYGNNSTTNMMPSTASGVDVNAGEHLLFESYYPQYTGWATTATSNTVSLSGLSQDYTGEIASIVKGTGVGQSRYITGYSSGVITNSENWSVTPDGTSMFAIGYAVNRLVCYNSYFDGPARAVATDVNNPPTGFQAWSGGSEIIVDNNLFNELRGGSLMQSKGENSAISGTNSISPFYFNLISDNIITNTRDGLSVFCGFWDGHTDRPYEEYNGMLGNVYRNIEVKDTKDRGIWVDIFYSSNNNRTQLPYEFDNLTIYDGISVTNFDDKGIITNSYSVNSVWKNITTNGVSWEP
jgi:hypothetical protein